MFISIYSLPVQTSWDVLFASITPKTAAAAVALGEDLVAAVEVVAVDLEAVDLEGVVEVEVAVEDVAVVGDLVADEAAVVVEVDRHQWIKPNAVEALLPFLVRRSLLTK